MSATSHQLRVTAASGIEAGGARAARAAKAAAALRGTLNPPGRGGGDRLPLLPRFRVAAPAARHFRVENAAY